MEKYQPWDESWRDQLAYIMVPYEIEMPVEAPSDFVYPIFLGVLEKRLGGDDFWKAIAGAMVYVIGHQPDYTDVPLYVKWINSYNADIVNELIYDGAEQASKNNLETAVWLFQAAVLVNPQSAEAHFNLGLAYYQVGLALNEEDKKEERESCYRQATQYLENAVVLDPQFCLAYYNLGFIYKRMGRPDDSRKCMEKGILLGLDKMLEQTRGANSNSHQQ